MGFELSTYQKEILDFYVKNPTKNMMINALAGSGKSSTACILSDNTTAYSVYLAFNASVVEEFKTRITNPKVKVYTMHSLAYAIMNDNLNNQEDDSPSQGFGRRNLSNKGAKLDNLKMYNIFDKLLLEKYGRSIDFLKKNFYKDNLVNLYNLCHLSLVDTEDYVAVDNMIEDHCVFECYGDEDYPPIDTRDCMTLLKNAESKSLTIFKRENIIDFTDMLWITYQKLKAKEWEVPFWGQFTNVISDECQDFNKLQQSFLRFIKRKNGRYVFIGDAQQAIYGFAGADTNAYSNIKKMFAPLQEFDLPICYRCAKSHLYRVNQLYDIPILPRPDAPEGLITIIEKKDIAKIIPTLKGSSMVISRKNKWLSEVIMSLAKSGSPVYISDKELISGVKKVITSSKAKTVGDLQDHLIKAIIDYKEKLKQSALNINTLTEEDAEEAVVESSKIDNINFVLGIIRGYLKQHDNKTSIPIQSFETFVDRTLNTKPSTNSVRICSVHKAKGLEADNVFVLNEAKVCRDFRNSAEQNKQERNLSYISITRAKQNLYLVKEPAKGKKLKEEKY